MAVAEKVIFAEDTATVHIRSGDPVDYPDGTKYEPHESKVLLPGETVTLSEVPTYMADLVKEGKAPGLTLLTVNQAKRLVDKANKIKTVKISDLIDDEDETE